MNKLEDIYLDALNQVSGLSFKYAAATKSAGISWKGVKEQVFKHKDQIIHGAIGAAVAGGASALASTRKDWETEDEFRRRRASSAMGAGVLGAAVGGFAQPVFNKIQEAFKKPTPEERARIEQEKARKDIADASTAVKDLGNKSLAVADEVTRGHKGVGGAIVGGAGFGLAGLKQTGQQGSRASIARRLMNLIDERPTASLAHSPADLSLARKAWTRANELNAKVPSTIHTPQIPMSGSTIDVTPRMISPGVGESALQGANRYVNRFARGLGRGGMALIPTAIGATAGYFGGAALDSNYAGQGAAPGS